MLYSIKRDNEVLYSSNDTTVIRGLQPAYKNSYIHYSQEAIDMINNNSFEVIKVPHSNAVILANKDTYVNL